MKYVVATLSTLAIAILAYGATLTSPLGLAILNQDAATPQSPGVLDIVPHHWGGAWSITHRLSTNYSGPLITASVLFSSTTNDIGFNSSGVLDTNALLTIAAAHSGYLWIERVYDQSGNPWDLQTTDTNRWPMVVSNNVFIAGPGFPMSARWDGASNRLANLSAPTVSLPFMHFTTIHQRALVTGDFVLGGNSTTAGIRQTTANALRLNQGDTLCNSSALSLGTWYLATAFADSSTNDYVQIGTNSPSIGSAGNNSITGGFTWGSITMCASFNTTMWLCYTNTLTDPNKYAVQQAINAMYNGSLY